MDRRATFSPLHERHARAEQCAEHSRETRHRELRHERTNEWRAQNEPFPRATANFRHEPVSKQDEHDHDGHGNEQAVMPHRIADADDHAREQRQRRAEAFEDELESRNEKHEQKHENPQRHHQQDHRDKASRS
jgi:hypothetical protein